MADGSFPVLISKNDDANSPANPIHVQLANAPEVITNIQNYQTTPLASNASANHDYAVVGSFFRLKSVIVASTGNAKFEIKVGPVATLVSKAVAFTSAQGQYAHVPFDPPIIVPLTGSGTVRVVKTNRQNSANDVYATIIGEDVA